LDSIDWAAYGIPNNGFFRYESTYQRRAAALIAAAIVRSGFTQVESAPTLYESWRRYAVKMGVRLVRPQDWDIFWRRVVYEILAEHWSIGTSSLVGEVKKVMVPPLNNVYWRRAAYFQWATRFVPDLTEFSKLVKLVLARAAHDAEMRNVDRPTWFNEMVSLRDALDEARFSAVGKPDTDTLQKTEGVGYSVSLGDNEVLVKEENDQLVYINKKGYTPGQVRNFAMALLEAAEMSEKTA
jgi:hypothetical protein